MTNTIEIENFFLLFTGMMLVLFAFVSLTAIVLTLVGRLNSKEQRQTSKKQSGQNTLSNDEVMTARRFINAMNKVKNSKAPKAHAERRSRYTSNIVEINKFNDHRNKAKQEVEEVNEALADIVGYSSNNLHNGNSKFKTAINGDELEFEDDIEFEDDESDDVEDYDERTYG